MNVRDMNDEQFNAWCEECDRVEQVRAQMAAAEEAHDAHRCDCTMWVTEYNGYTHPSAKGDLCAWYQMEIGNEGGFPAEWATL